MTRRNQKKEELVRIKLPRIPGEDAIFVSVGNRQWRIKRGVEVEIPKCAYEVIRNAELAEDAAVRYIESAT